MIKRDKQKLKTISLLLTALYTQSTYAANTEKAPNFDFDALLMFDYDQFSEHFLESSDQGGDDLYVRRASLSAKYQFNKDWQTKLKVDVSDGLELKDAFVKYKGWQFADITIGKHKEPFGLERQMSSKNLLFTERNMVSNAIAPGRSYGMSLKGEQGIVNWQLGYFVSNLTNDSDYTTAFTGKLSVLPWQNKHGRLHLGASLSQRSYYVSSSDTSNASNSGYEFRINEKMDIYGADSLIEGDNLYADSSSLSGVEFLWQHSGFTALAEWQRAQVTTEQGEEYLYDGGFTQVSYMLSGKNRKYKNGVLGGAGKKNDWELAARYNKFNLHEENSEATALSFGVNYYLNKDFKFSADYIQANYVDNGQDMGTGDAISLRFQYQF